MNIQTINKINQLKRIIVKAAAESGEGHIASAFSIMEILWVLYEKVLDIDPSNPSDPNRDVFILSKGHASLGIYAMLAHKGFFQIGELDNFCKYDSILGGHPNRTKVPGIEASTGSLGHGFPIAVGMAMAYKAQQLRSKIFVLIGDGEMNEGSIWESALIASHHNLTNLCGIVDYNHSTDRALDLGNLIEKFEAMGWESMAVDGHDTEKISRTLSSFPYNKPLMIIAETVKGKGVKIMENNPEWHHKSPNPTELEEILTELA